MKILTRKYQNTAKRIQSLPMVLGAASILFLAGLQPVISAEDSNADSSARQTQSSDNAEDTTLSGESLGGGDISGGASTSQEPAVVSAPPKEEDGIEISSKNLKASDFIGAKVKNTEGTKLGEIKDLMINWPDRKMNYAILSFGGVAGIGAKLIAIPIDELKAASQGAVLILDVSKDRLEQVEGFEVDNPPEMADASLFESSGEDGTESSSMESEQEEKSLLEKAAEKLANPGR